MHTHEQYGPVEALNQGRTWLGLGPLMTVRCYAVDGLLIDTGLFARQKEVLGFAQARGVEQVAITHHHEDHSNNAGPLQAAGMEVHASAHTRALIAQGFGTRFYQWVAWGPARPATPSLLPPVLETEHHRFEVLPAPGHCDDQVVFYEPNEGWLFSGDVFLAERVKVFRRDEDFHATMATLERLCALEVSSLFCAHWPIPDRGGEALRGKLQHLREVEGRVRELHERGWSDRAIAREVLGPEKLSFYLLSMGDASRINLVRAILYGHRPRPDTGYDPRSTPPSG